MKLTVNPTYQRLLPDLPAEEYTALKRSIEQEGQYLPIIVNTDGVVLDGHHRFKVCQELGLTPKVEVKTFANPLLEKRFVIEANLQRRQLNKFQKVELAYPLEAIEKELAKQRQGMRTDLLTSGSNDPQFGRVRDIVSERAGVSSKTYSRAKKIIESGSDELKEDLRSGKRSITSAYNEVMNRTKTAKQPPVHSEKTLSVERSRGRFLIQLNTGAYVLELMSRLSKRSKKQE